VTIEFSCDHCGKALSTTDDKAGRTAKCPGCGEAITVPFPSAADNDEDSVAATSTVTCPMCGAENRGDARECESCGEPLKKTVKRGHERIDAGDVLSASWRIFKQEMGMVIGGVLVAGVINFAISLPQSVLGAIAGIMQQQGEGETALLLQTLSWCFLPIAYLGQWFITCGLQRMLLNIARGESAQFGDLFSGGKYLWRMAGASILFGLMIAVGLLCLIIPGIFWR